MLTLDEKQTETAQAIVGQLRDLRSDRSALWQLNGAVGSGKTTVLRRVAELLQSERLVPILVTAPAGEIDSAPIALLEAARQLKTSGVLNGEMSIICDPAKHWREKMDAITAAVDRNHEDVVLLCDEPTRWYHFHESLLDDSPDYNARSLSEWMVNGARCRRIITGWIPNDRPAGRTYVPRLDDGRELLEPDAHWDDLGKCASRLHDSLTEPVPDRSAWEIKLCVALCAFGSADEVASLSMSEATANVILDRVLDQVEERPDFADVGTALAQLALARTELDEVVLAEFFSGLDPLKKSLIEKCLFDWNGGRGGLHPLVRHEVLSRASDPHRVAMKSPWRLSKASRIAVHDRLKSQYRNAQDSSARECLESLHHDLLGTPSNLLGQDVRLQSLKDDARLQFVEQLDEIGRTLSHVHHEHRRAAQLFRLALLLDSEHAYSHHYLAFNLDWLADESDEVETHYIRAIQLQPTHPWWWSRWISYLATRGRSRDAKSNWRNAVDALSISEDGSPDWMFLSLHRWVARWLLHWAELDFAEEVLRSVPKHLTENDASIRTLWDLLAALRQAERGVSVFPLSVPAREWWSPTPHTDLPSTWEGHPLRTWTPARVEGVDQVTSTAFLVAATRPSTADSEPQYFEIELSRDNIRNALPGFGWEDLREGAFVELGYYGDGCEPARIGLHRDTTWYDPHLLPLVPPPDRWYRRAVEHSWASKPGAD